jgi:hypothetical protein
VEECRQGWARWVRSGLVECACIKLRTSRQQHMIGLASPEGRMTQMELKLQCWLSSTSTDTKDVRCLAPSPVRAVTKALISLCICPFLAGRSHVFFYNVTEGRVNGSTAGAFPRLPVASKAQVALHITGSTLTFSVQQGDGPMVLQTLSERCTLPSTFFVVVSPGAQGSSCSIHARWK